MTEHLLSALQETEQTARKIERLLAELIRAQEEFQERVAKVSAIVAIEQARQED
jgi:hypothetical protein